MVVTRFAPSPTGDLHIGGVRTTLFNWLYAKHFGGKFFLRIEDTDRERSSDHFTESIYRSLKWLGLNWDGEPVLQHQNMKRHQEVAFDLLKKGKAYKCFSTQEELEKVRQEAIDSGNTPRYNGKWRNETQHPNLPFVIRLRAPLEGRTEFFDLVQGPCGVDNSQMDDMVLLRSDGNPTYMLSVVVDDYDMEITHVIRGCEHLNNAYRQKLIYDACGWKSPEFAHIPLIHGEDGAKLSKRHGATNVEEYKKYGFLKEALLNYLVRLGWSHGDDEIISLEDCIKLFDIKDVGRSAARFDMAKLYHVNSVYMRAISDVDLLEILREFCSEFYTTQKYSEAGWKRVLEAMPELKVRVRTLVELLEMSEIYGYGENYFGPVGPNPILEHILAQAKECAWQGDDKTEIWLRSVITSGGFTLKDAAPILRTAITKRTVAPSLFEVMKVLGVDLFIKRLENSIK